MNIATIAKPPTAEDRAVISRNSKTSGGTSWHKVQRRLGSTKAGFPRELAHRRRDFLDSLLRCHLSRRDGGKRGRAHNRTSHLRPDHFRWTVMTHIWLKSRHSTRSVRWLRRRFTSACGGEKCDPRIRRNVVIFCRRFQTRLGCCSERLDSYRGS